MGILPGSIATNMRVHQSTWHKDSSKADNNIDFTIGMNSSILESAISEQLFCNDKVNPNNEPCYGISTVSGLQRATQQGQKIYQIDSKNRDQLKNIAMSDENMADDINIAIASGGYVIVPEKAVDGTGRNAIYVYMTHNGQDGYQSWKISGGLNGGTFNWTEFSDSVTVAAYAIDAIDIASGFLDFFGKVGKWLGNVFGFLSVIMDLLGAIANIGAIIEKCGLSVVSILGVLNIIFFTAFTMAISILTILAFTGPFAILFFGVISSILSIFFNNVMSRVVRDITGLCKK